MPLSNYYGGKGEAVMSAMRKRYGPQAGKRVFYATVNRQRKGSSAERAIQPKAAPGSALKRARERL